MAILAFTILSYSLLRQISYLEDQVHTLSQQVLQQSLYLDLMTDDPIPGLPIPYNQDTVDSHDIPRIQEYYQLLTQHLFQCHSQLVTERESALAAIDTVANVAVGQYFEQTNTFRKQHELLMANIVEGAIDAIIQVASTKIP
jgi:hypothetical protein